MDHFTFIQWGMLAAALSGIGAVAGFFSGLLGIGGGLILVPGFYFCFKMLGFPAEHLMHIALGTSMAAILPTGFSSARAHWKRGAVDTGILKKIVPGTSAGALAGILIAHYVPGEGLQALFGFAVLLVAAIMFADPKRYTVFASVPGWPVAPLAGFCIGILAALMGIAGALLCVPFLAMCRVPMHTAVGTSAGVGLTVSLPSAIGFIVIGMAAGVTVPYTLGYLNLPAWLLVIPAGMLAAPLGARAAHAMDVNRLRRVFAVFMTVIALRMLFEAWHG